MNTLMWDSPLTARQLDLLTSLGQPSNAVRAAAGTASYTASGGSVDVGRSSSPTAAAAAVVATAAAAAAGPSPASPAWYITSTSAAEEAAAAAACSSSVDVAAAAAAATSTSSTAAASAVTVISPVSKRLACGDVGIGAMASVEDVAGAVAAALERRRVALGDRPGVWAPPQP